MEEKILICEYSGLPSLLSYNIKEINMKKEITFISDTHGKHNELTKDLPGGFMIIHAGDVSNQGLIYEINQFTEWFSKLPYTYKIFIAGNHDFGFEEIRKSYEVGISIPHGVIYLQDEMVEIEGIKIYGSPWQPEFYNWAFNLPRGEKLAEKWALIPGNTDILITHGPAFRMLDHVPSGMMVGCEDLFNRIIEVKPKIHASGHIHHARGAKEFNDTLFINASICTERYDPTNKPFVVEFDNETKEWEMISF